MSSIVQPSLSPTLKRCTKCRVEKQLTDFGRNSKAKDGLFHWCRACVKEQHRLYYTANRDKLQKEALERYYAHRDERMASNRAWRAANRERELARLKAYKVAHHEELRQRRLLDYQARPQVYRDRSRAYAAKQMAVNPGWRREKYQGHYLRYAAQYKRRSRRHRVVRAGVIGDHTEAQWQELLTRYGQKCLRCGTHQGLTPDHVIPLSKGGSDFIDNIQPLCGPCNSAKRHRTWDFRPQG